MRGAQLLIFIMGLLFVMIISGLRMGGWLKLRFGCIFRIVILIRVLRLIFYVGLGCAMSFEILLEYYSCRFLSY